MYEPTEYFAAVLETAKIIGDDVAELLAPARFRELRTRRKCGVSIDVLLGEFLIDLTSLQEDHFDRHESKFFAFDSWTDAVVMAFEAEFFQ